MVVVLIFRYSIGALDDEFRFGISTKMIASNFRFGAREVFDLARDEVFVLICSK